MMQYRQLPKVLVLFLSLVSLIGYFTFVDWPFSTETALSTEDLLEFGTLLFFLSLICMGALGQLRQHAPPVNLLWNVRGWAVGLLIALVFMVGTVLYINPNRLYGPMFRDDLSYQFNARRAKIELYNRLEEPPEVMLLGSSRAFYVSAAYIEKTSGYRTFNGAVEGGTPFDYVTWVRYLADQPDFPPVLLVEITPTWEINHHDFQRLWPIQVVPYMPDDRVRWQTVGERFERLFSTKQVAEAIYTYVTRDDYARRPFFWGRYAPYDALGDYLVPAFLRPDDMYQDQLDYFASREITLCTGGYPERVELLTQLVTVAEQHESRVVFYVGPRHPDKFYALMQDSAQYRQCYETFTAFMDELLESHPDVFFLDYMDPATIGATGAQEGFRDYYHLAPVNANLLVDKASPTIQQAYAAAEQLRATH